MKTTFTKAKNIRAGESIETAVGARRVLRVLRQERYRRIEWEGGVWIVREDTLLSRVGPSAATVRIAAT